MKFKKLNDKQRKKTADILSELSKDIFLATVIGFFVPGVGSKVGIIGFILGLVVSLIFYFIAMWLLREEEVK